MEAEKSHDLPSETRNPGKQVMQVILRAMPKYQECQRMKVRERGCPTSNRESKFAISSPFCSILTLKELHDSHCHWGGQSSLLFLLVQMLISSRNTLTDTPRNCFTRCLGIL